MYNITLNNAQIGYEGKTLLCATTQFHRGELCALVGRNGTGKSTLLRVLAGVARRPQGEVLVDGVDLAKVSARELAGLVSFVSTERVGVANLTVEDVVSLGRTPYTNWLGGLRSEDRDVVDWAMRRLGVHEFAGKNVSTLSDGENARVMIARALAQQTPVILLDEPTAFLDIAGKYELCEMLDSLCSEGKTIIFSSHDLSTVWATRCSIALIYEGELHHAPMAEMCYGEALSGFFRESGFEMDYSTGALRRL